MEEIENNKKLNSLYLFYGDERYLIEETVKKIKKSFDNLQKGINYIEISENNIIDIIQDLETPAFGFDKKLIIVRNSGLFKKDTKAGNVSSNREKIDNYLKDNFEYIKNDNILVFVEEDVLKNLNIYKTIQKYGIVQEYNFLKPLQIRDRLKKICMAYNVKMSDENLNYFIDIVRN